MNLEKKYLRKRIGEKYITNEGYEAIIVDGGSRSHHCTIQIKDWIKEVQIGHLTRGEIKYPYNKSFYGVGFTGDGSHKTNGGYKPFRVWRGMLERCYSHESGAYKNYGFKNVTVCKQWHNFQIFASWYERYYPRDGGEYEIDKDLRSGENKIYSPETCIFIPRSLNGFVTNIRSNNTSGYTGVSWHKNNDKWVAHISVNGKSKYLGYFSNIEDASEAYNLARHKTAKKLQDYYNFDYPKHILRGIK